MKKIIAIVVLMIIHHVSSAQGCVAIRSNGNSCSIDKPGSDKGWKLNINNRYFRSYKHFVGTVEQKQRVDSGTEVVNRSYAVDLTATRTFNKRWSLAMSIPIASNVRSSKYEHYGNASKNANARRSTSSFGLGDARLVLYYWLLDPAKHSKGNIQAGMGIKLPTGEYRYQGYFYSNDSTYNIGPVDQSIQLGDGGTGIIAELKAFYNISHRVNVYTDLFYLSNPREQNGVSTARGGTPSANSVKYFTSMMSVPDQYMARAGVGYMQHHFSFSGGLRVEGIPSDDLIGGNRGFRRPGYVLSVEPVIGYSLKQADIYFSVPVAIKRDRVQSYGDKLQSAATGTKVQGDAAFADYLVSFGCTIKL